MAFGTTEKLISSKRHVNITIHCLCNLMLASKVLARFPYQEDSLTI
jgi:hypothetical protein